MMSDRLFIKLYYWLEWIFMFNCKFFVHSIRDEKTGETYWRTPRMQHLNRCVLCSIISIRYSSTQPFNFVLLIEFKQRILHLMVSLNYRFKLWINCKLTIIVMGKFTGNATVYNWFHLVACIITSFFFVLVANCAIRKFITLSLCGFSDKHWPQTYISNIQHYTN